MGYEPKNEGVNAAALRLQRLALPFRIQGNATPASVVVTVDDPAILFLKTQGVNGITLAAGAVSSASELSAITFAAATDATGVFNALVKIQEPIAKIVAAYVVRRNAAEIVGASLTSAPATGITSAGDKLVFNIDTAADLSSGATDFQACLIVEYFASPR